MFAAEPRTPVSEPRISPMAHLSAPPPPALSLGSRSALAGARRHGGVWHLKAAIAPRMLGTPAPADVRLFAGHGGDELGACCDDDDDDDEESHRRRRSSNIAQLGGVRRDWGEVSLAECGVVDGQTLVATVQRTCGSGAERVGCSRTTAAPTVFALGGEPSRVAVHRGVVGLVALIFSPFGVCVCVGVFVLVCLCVFCVFALCVCVFVFVVGLWLWLCMWLWMCVYVRAHSPSPLPSTASPPSGRREDSSATSPPRHARVRAALAPPARRARPAAELVWRVRGRRARR
jgi:hypothetical protein